jgi:hypothetical protein
MVKHLGARDQREAYDYWATFFDDPALMNNREARLTRFKIDSVVLLLPDAETVERTLCELVRVCRCGGTIFVGEVPFRAEIDGGVPSYLVRKTRELGLAGMWRQVYRTYLRPVLRGEPLMTFSLGETLHFPPEEFAELCRRHGVEVDIQRQVELRRPPLTRNDYLLRVPAISRR